MYCINELIVSMAESLDITSVVITHDMHSVLEVAEKVVFLDDHKLSWFGSIEEMKSSDYEPLVDFTTASEYQIKE